MRPTATGPGLGKASFRAKKSFGQNFLVQQSAIRQIVQAALASKAGRILEIGPGKGAITAPLLEDGRPLWAIELDDEACEHIGQRFASQPHFHLLKGDAARVELPDGPDMNEGGPPGRFAPSTSPLLLPHEVARQSPATSSWSVVGNLPYNAATAILGRFLLEPIPWERMVFMFQLEVAQKLLGKPGEKAYGPLSVIAQLACRMTRLLKLGPSAFNPAPKVDSAVILFERRPGAPDPETLRELQSLLFRAFAHRRKTLANNLGSAEIISELGLPPAIRAEAIEPSLWLTMSAMMKR